MLKSHGAICIHPNNLFGTLIQSSTEIHTVLCMYSDTLAIRALASIPHELRANLSIGVLGSDIYSMKPYLTWQDYATFFVAPSDAHAATLKTFLRKDIFVLEEMVDPAAGETFLPARTDFDGWLTWFGYPESFNKGMSHLMPVIHSCVESGAIKGLQVITQGSGNALPDWIKIIPYDTRTIASHLSKSTYCILSHFPYDMHINSLIKSDNKAVLSLALGALPIASNTPNYAKLMNSLSMQDLLYSGPSELESILQKICKNPLSLQKQQRIAISNMLYSRSAGRTAARLLHIINSI